MKTTVTIPYYKVNSLGFSYEFMGITFAHHPMLGWCYLERDDNETTEVYFGNELKFPHGSFVFEQDGDEESETYMDFVITFIPNNER